MHPSQFDGEPCALLLDFDRTCTYHAHHSTIRMINTFAMPAEARAKSETLRGRFERIAHERTLNPDEALEWLDGEISLFAEFGTTEKKMRAALERVELREGVPELIRAWQASGWPVGIFSFSAAQPIEWIMERYGLSVFVAAARLRFSAGRVAGWVDGTEVIPTTKGVHAQRFCLDRGVRYLRAFGVGDSPGDGTLGPFENRQGIARNPEEAATIAPFFSEVHVTETFAPILASLERRIGRPL